MQGERDRVVDFHIFSVIGLYVGYVNSKALVMNRVVYCKFAGPVYNLNDAVEKKKAMGISKNSKSDICYFGGSSRFPQIRAKVK